MGNGSKGYGGRGTTLGGVHVTLPSPALFFENLSNETTDHYYWGHREEVWFSNYGAVVGVILIEKLNTVLTCRHFALF